MIYIKLSVAIQGLNELLIQNHYSTPTINSYKRIWSNLAEFLIAKYSNDLFSIEKGMEFLNEKYNFSNKLDSKELSQREVQLLRIINIIQDYKQFGVLTRRFYSNKIPIELKTEFSNILKSYNADLDKSSLSTCTKNHYNRIILSFLDYLQQKQLTQLKDLTIVNINNYISTLSVFSYKTIEQNICGIRNFLKYINDSLYFCNEYSEKIHMPQISKQAKIPSSWTKEEINSLFKVIKRNNPIGKRNYAMIVLAVILGLRISDIKNLKFENLKWREKLITIIQHKTNKQLTLPMTNTVGWALIDYIKNGRPKFNETNYVFIKHTPPFNSFSDSNHCSEMINLYMQKAGIYKNRNHKIGFHSLRHTAASMLLDDGVELPVISSILGHSDVNITAVYLKTDLAKLKECVLNINLIGNKNDDI